MPQREQNSQVYAFINARSYEETRSLKARSKVSRHIGKYYRNRSKPVQTRSLTQVSSRRFALANNHESSSSDDEEESSKATVYTSFQASSTAKGRDGCGGTNLGILNEPDKLDTILLVQQSVRPHSRDRSMSNGYHSADVGPSLQTHLLSQNRADPFAIYAVRRCDRHIDLVLDHATRHFWPLLSPNLRDCDDTAVTNLYRVHMKASAIAYYTYVLVVSTNLEFLWDDHPLLKTSRNLRMTHIHEATKLVRQTIENMPAKPGAGDISDELVGSILGLCCTSSPYVINRTHLPVSRFRSPLANLQCLDMWGTLPFNESHRLAAVQLIRLRGGLQKLDSMHLALVAQLNDIIDATRKIRPPVLPWQSLLVQLPPTAWPCFDVSQTSHGVAFVPILSKLDTLVLINPLESTLSAVLQATATFEAPLSRNHTLSAEMVEMRNRAQHLALSLPSDPPDERFQLQSSVSVRCQSSLYNTIRLALLTYNNLVLYPMPLVSGVETRLVKQLKLEVARYSNFNPEDSDTQALLVWCIVLGGISTEDNDDQIWFQEQFTQLIESNRKLRKWRYTESLLSAFVWLDFILNEEAIKF